MNFLSTSAPKDVDELPNINLTAAAIANDFAEEFPTIFLLAEGRYPENASEIALLSSVANQLGIWNGDTLRYANTTGIAGPDGSVFRYEVMLHVVGIYTYAEQLLDNPLPYTRGDVIVQSELLGEINPDCWVYIGIDRSIVGPYDPMASLATLTSLDENIKNLDPLYAAGAYSPRFYLQDLLIGGIHNYIDWHNTNRISLLIDSISLLLVGSLISFIYSRHYYQRRKSEVLLLYERGSTKNQVLGYLAGEIITLSVVALVIGLIAGVLLSQVGMNLMISSSTNSLPLMIRIDSLILVTLVSFILPMLFLFSIKKELFTTERAEETRSRLRKFSQILRLLKLDSAGSILCILIIIITVQLSMTTTPNLVLDVILIFTPFVLFLAIANLVVKASSRLSYFLSRILERVTGRIAARVGIRSLGRREGNIIPLMMLLILISSMIWASLLIDDNISTSYLNQTKFAIGGDVTIKLDNDQSDLWNPFMENVSMKIPSSSMTMVFQHSMFLSAGLEGSVNFYALNPLDYSRVGYDQNGVPLDSTNFYSLLTMLSANRSGAIVTQDVADEFQLTIGGSMRGFRANGTGFDVILFTVIGIVSYLPDFLVLNNGYISPTSAIYPEVVGSNKVWINRNYMSDFIPSSESTASYLCMRMNNTNDISGMIDEVRSSDTENVIEQNGVAIASVEADRLLRSETFVFDSIYNNISRIIMISVLPVILLVLSESNLNSSKDYRHILRTIGYNQDEVSTVYIAQSLGLFILATSLTLLFSLAQTYAKLGIYILNYGRYVLHFPEILILTNQGIVAASVIFLLFLLSIFFIIGMRILTQYYGRGLNECTYSSSKRIEEIE